MTTRVLDAIDDAAAWKSALARLPHEMQDIYFSPAYLAMHRLQQGSKASMFTYENGKDFWTYSFIIQPISHIGDRELETKWSDIESPYGYGGPLSTTHCGTFLAEAHGAFDDWCDSNGVVAEFVRFHPLLGNHDLSAPDTNVILDRETVSLALERDGEEIRIRDKDSRYMLRRASRSGIRVGKYPARKFIGDFMNLYTTTMKRQDAPEYYYFGDEYFSDLAEVLENNGWILAAVLNECWVAAAIFLCGAKSLHYHLAASDTNVAPPGAMNQLLYFAAQLGSEQGMQRLHLGGGRTADPDDSLLKFKRSMASDSHHYQIGTRVHRPEAYSQLKVCWQEKFPELVHKYSNRILCYRYES